MKISSLNQRIQIQKIEVTQDDIGQEKETYTTIYSCKAYASTNIKATEQFVVGTDLDSPDVIFTVRYAKILDTLTTNNHRIIFNNQVYDIKGIDPMNYDKKTIKIMAKKKNFDNV